MASRIDVQYAIADTRSLLKLRQFTKLGLSGKLSGVTVVDSYVVDAPLSQKELGAVAGTFANPVVEKAFVNAPARLGKFEWALEIGYLPGVTDNVGNTAREAMEDFLKIKFKDGESVYTSRVYFLSGKISRADVKKIADSLHNPLIQSARIKTFDQYKKAGLGADVPKVKLSGKNAVLEVDLNISKKELTRLGKEGVLDNKGNPRGPLALNTDYLLAIKNYFKSLGRKPTDIELETFAQTWSEHCKHTIFASPIDEVPEGLYKGYIKAATNEIRKKKGKKDFCVSVFTDNSGAIIFDDQYLISHKVETHNSPSALDPFGGAITGIGGVNRDCIGFGMGAKPVINTYGFCFAPRESRGSDRSVGGQNEEKLYRDKALQNPMLSPKRIMEGVVAGVNAGGNTSGIPTPQGFVYFDQRYKGKPLVFAGTVGLIPKKKGKHLLHQKVGRPGDYIVMAGGRIGLDGIHGATFSSGSLNEKSPATAVQIGDPITQKKMSDALIKEARNQGLYSSITDCGAGGLSSAVAEMANDIGGCEVDLDKAPLKYPGLEPWQIWISESQERMIMAVPKNKVKKLQELLKSRGVESTAIGKFTNTGKCVVKYEGKKIVDLDLEFLHNGLPERRLKSKKPAPTPSRVGAPTASVGENLSQSILDLVAEPNLASFAFISEQYDHEVQSSSILKPLQGRGRINAQSTITRPVLNSNKGVVLSYGYYPEYSEVDPYNMAASSIDTAIRNAVASGGNVDYLALLDNFCWCSSNDPERLYQLKLAAKACYDYATAFGTPFISGKDSMFNDFSGFNEQGKAVKISIPPTLLISAIGVVNNIEKVVSEDVKFAGDLVYVLGNTFDEVVPEVDAEMNLKLYRKVYQAIKQNLLASSISVTRGGLAAALSKMSIGGSLGLDISLGYLPGQVVKDGTALFSESQGRLVVTIDPKNKDRFEKLMEGLPFANIGKVGGSNIVIRNRVNKPVVLLKVEDVLFAYHSTFKDF